MARPCPSRVGASGSARSDADAGDRAHGDGASVDASQLVESMEVVVGVDIQGEARQQAEVEAGPGPVEGAREVVGEILRINRADADAAVDEAADHDEGLRRDGIAS